jgi:hypothetical protein
MDTDGHGFLNNKETEGAKIFDANFTKSHELKCAEGAAEIRWHGQSCEAGLVAANNKPAADAKHIMPTTRKPANKAGTGDHAIH